MAEGSRASTSGEVDGATRVDGERPIAMTSAAASGTTSKSKLTRRKRTDDADDTASAPSRLVKGGKAVKKGSDIIRSRIASIVWLLCVLAAIILAAGALLFALDANMKNDLVKAVIDTAEKIDGPFWRIFEFRTDTKGPGAGPHDATKEHLVNWGLAAVAYLIVGRVLNRIIRP